MSKPKPNKLAAALNQQAKGPQAQTSEAPARKETTRQARIMMSAWLPIEARSSVRLIQAQHPEKRTQNLIAEAMNLLFAKYNVPQTAGDNHG